MTFLQNPTPSSGAAPASFDQSAWANIAHEFYDVHGVVWTFKNTKMSCFWT
jgi:hypothetical protein